MSRRALLSLRMEAPHLLVTPPRAAASPGPLNLCHHHSHPHRPRPTVSPRCQKASPGPSPVSPPSSSHWNPDLGDLLPGHPLQGFNSLLESPAQLSPSNPSQELSQGEDRLKVTELIALQWLLTLVVIFCSFQWLVPVLLALPLGAGPLCWRFRGWKGKQVRAGTGSKMLRAGNQCLQPLRAVVSQWKC